MKHNPNDTPVTPDPVPAPHKSATAERLDNGKASSGFDSVGATSAPPPEAPAPTIIRPTIGRVVWYWREAVHSVDAQPEAAIVCHVHNASLVNLFVIDRDGGGCGVREVVLRQPGEGVPAVAYAEWMPYQVGQAARHTSEPAK